MNQASRIKQLYRRLTAVGLTRAYVVGTALPTWWDDEVAANPAGFAQGMLLISRHLGLDLASLQNPSESVRLRSFGVCKFKKRPDVSEDQLALARVIATRAAQLAAAAVSSRPLPIPSDPLDIRQLILDRGACWVSLDELLEYCWSVGLPVLHVDHFPKNACRPDGFAARVDGRPVIVLCRRAKHSAWLLFILAHELGHLALGHVPENGSLIDEGMDPSSEDEEERAANQFALALLNGNSGQSFVASGRWPNAAELARAAGEIGHQKFIDPGHIVLNYAHSMGKSFYPVGMAAANLLEPNFDAVKHVRAKLAAHLDWGMLPEDSSEFLMRVTRHGHDE